MVQSGLLRAGEAEAVEDAVVGAHVDPAVGYGEFSEVDPAFDLVSAGVEFLAGLAVEGVEGGVGGGGDSHFAGIAEP